MILSDHEYHSILDAQKPITRIAVESRELRYLALETQQKVKELLAAYVKQERKEQLTAPF